MNRCTSCNTDSPADAKACRACGAELTTEVDETPKAEGDAEASKSEADE